jgi:hypothetical protein
VFKFHEVNEIDANGYGRRRGRAANLNWAQPATKENLYLLGTEMDYRVDRLSSRFVFNNPNQKSACGCGESIDLVPAEKEKLEALKS